MAPFNKRQNRFGGGNRGGFKPSGGRPRFGGGRPGGRPDFNRSRDDRGGERPEMFTATCANCGKQCEVPFRPTGERPVYCSDCFRDKTRGESPSDRGRGGEFSRYSEPRSTPSRSPMPEQATDKRIDDLKKQLEATNNKLDMVLQLIRKMQSPAEKANENNTLTAMVHESDVAPKKKKPAPKKKPASKKK